MLTEKDWEIVEYVKFNYSVGVSTDGDIYELKNNSDMIQVIVDEQLMFNPLIICMVNLRYSIPQKPHVVCNIKDVDDLKKLENLYGLSY